MAKCSLEKYFIIDKDYKVLLNQQAKQSNDTRGGHNKQIILLNIRTFFFNKTKHLKKPLYRYPTHKAMPHSFLDIDTLHLSRTIMTAVVETFDKSPD